MQPTCMNTWRSRTVFSLPSLPQGLSSPVGRAQLSGAAARVSPKKGHLPCTMGFLISRHPGFLGVAISAYGTGRKTNVIKHFEEKEEDSQRDLPMD